MPLRKVVYCLTVYKTGSYSNLQLQYVARRRETYLHKNSQVVLIDRSGKYCFKKLMFLKLKYCI